MDTTTTNSIRTKTGKIELNTSQADQPSESDTESLTMTENINDNVLQTTTTVPVMSESSQPEQVKEIAESAVTSLTSSKKTIIPNSPTGSTTK
jgi:transcriptional/translational regulatory protein YebC/TACO1